MNTFFRKVGAYIAASYQRFNTESPRYWKTIQTFLNWLMVATATVSDAGQTIIVQMTGYGLDVPPIVKVIAGHIATAAFLSRLIAGLAVKKEAITERTYEKLTDPAAGVKPQSPS